MTIKTLTRNEAKTLQIQAHGNALIGLFKLPIGTDPIKLCKQLHRLESSLHRLAEQYCNGDIDMDAWESQADAKLGKVQALLKLNKDDDRVFVNSDPRGYALKVPEAVAKPHPIYKDWGGYGIVCPNIDGTDTLYGIRGVPKRGRV